MDGGGDNQRGVGLFRNQEQRQRQLVHRERRAANIAASTSASSASVPVALNAAVPADPVSPDPAPTVALAPDSEEGVLGMNALIMADLAEDSGFESGSEGEYTAQ